MAAIAGRNPNPGKPPSSSSTSSVVGPDVSVDFSTTVTVKSPVVEVVVPVSYTHLTLPTT